MKFKPNIKNIIINVKIKEFNTYYNFIINKFGIKTYNNLKKPFNINNFNHIIDINYNNYNIKKKNLKKIKFLSKKSKIYKLTINIENEKDKIKFLNIIKNYKNTIIILNNITVLSYFYSIFNLINDYVKNNKLVFYFYESKKIINGSKFYMLKNQLKTINDNLFIKKELIKHTINNDILTNNDLTNNNLANNKSNTNNKKNNSKDSNLISNVSTDNNMKVDNEIPCYKVIDVIYFLKSVNVKFKLFCSLGGDYKFIYDEELLCYKNIVLKSNRLFYYKNFINDHYILAFLNIYLFRTYTQFYINNNMFHLDIINAFQNLLKKLNINKNNFDIFEISKKLLKSNSVQNVTTYINILINLFEIFNIYSSVKKNPWSYSLIYKIMTTYKITDSKYITELLFKDNNNNIYIEQIIKHNEINYSLTTEELWLDYSAIVKDDIDSFDIVKSYYFNDDIVLKNSDLNMDTYYFSNNNNCSNYKNSYYSYDTNFSEPKSLLSCERIHKPITYNYDELFEYYY